MGGLTEEDGGGKSALGGGMRRRWGIGREESLFYRRCYDLGGEISKGKEIRKREELFDRLIGSTTIGRDEA
jgi:hypothetical protein